MLTCWFRGGSRSLQNLGKESAKATPNEARLHVTMSSTVQVSLLVLALNLVSASLSGQRVEEELFIVHLPDARTMAHFQFSVTWNIHPLVLAEDFKGDSGPHHVS